MTEHKPQPITDSQFAHEVLQAEGIAVVDFWAPWCGPCHQMSQVLEAFATANGDAVRVFKLDVDENPRTADRYEIRGVPTIIFFYQGNPVYTSRGAMSASNLKNKLDELLKTREKG